jgi:THO complex subunit 4
MSANLDKSLDDLVGNRRQNARRRGAGRRPTANASVGGVKKSSKATKAAAKVVHPTPAAPTASSKIIVSGLVRLPFFYPRLALYIH